MHLAIVEDEACVQEQLKNYVLEYYQGRTNEVKISLFSDGVEILENYSASYDVIFLDIQMKHLDGMETAQRIRERDEDVYLVFITNMVNYAIRGYSVNALDFVLKPVNYLMLRQLLIRVEHLMAQKPKRYITLPTETGLARIDVSQIEYVETEGRGRRLYLHGAGNVPTVEEHEERGGNAHGFRFLPVQQLLSGESASCGAHRKRCGYRPWQAACHFQTAP